MKFSVKFTSGTMQKEGEFYTLVLYVNSQVCYKATLGNDTAAKYMNKYDNIKMIK